MEDLIHNNSFRQWVNGEASLHQRRYWDQWVSRDPRNRSLAKRAQKHIAGFSIQPSSKPCSEHAWEKLQDDLKPANSLQNKAVSSSGALTTKLMISIAASFILLVGSMLAIRSGIPGQVEAENKVELVHEEIVTSYGEQKTIALNDGSKIVLNAHSSLVYSVNSADSNAVEVFLDGEAFFSVASRKHRFDAPFRVQTSAGRIRVMGTEFAVSTRNGNTQVVLEEGEVALNPINNDEERIMKPGQLALFGSGRDRIHIENVNPQVYTSWKSNALVFDETSFSDVTNRLEDTFGVKVIVRDTRLYKRKITGSIENTTLETITSALSKTLDVPITVTDSAVVVGKKKSARAEYE